MGKINLYYGVVNSRKSAELLLTHHRNKSVKKTAVFQPDINTRDGGKVKSRALKYSTDAIIIHAGSDLKKYGKEFDLLLIDEYQFLSREHCKQIVEMAATEDVQIFLYGLLSDFRGNLFKSTAYILPYVTSINEIKTVCGLCGKHKATMNKMVIPIEAKDDGIAVGNYFEGVCLKCMLNEGGISND